MIDISSDADADYSNRQEGKEMVDPSMTLSIWIGVFGKALVKKGVISKQDLIVELDDFKARLDPNNSHVPGLILEIDNMIAVVNRW